MNATDPRAVVAGAGPAASAGGGASAQADTAAEAYARRAALAAVLFAIDPAGTGVSLRSAAGPVRDGWLEFLRGLLPGDAPWRRVPATIAESRLLGGIDLAATLRAGTPIAERGVLAAADGGIVVLAMAERLGATTAAHVRAALDTREVAVERDGFALRAPARFGVLALDEGIEPDERPPAALLDRLALLVDLDGVRDWEAAESMPSAEVVAAARRRLPGVAVPDAVLEALCTAGVALGVHSIRPAQLAVRVARAAAALAGRDEVSAADASLAAQLVLAPRATRLPPPPEQEPAEPPPPSEAPPRDEDEAERDATAAAMQEPPPLEDVVLAAAQAAIPGGLLAALVAGSTRMRTPSSGKAGALRVSKLRGRPCGVRRGAPGAGARLDLIETLRAAAPWQRLRRAEFAAQAAAVAGSDSRVLVRPDDFHVTRYRERSETTTIFVVDASGSAALHRLAEAKGAVELLLAECYVRRDRVAVLAFRQRGAELLLPPTRSLVRAKRSLAGLAGGGGTPLAAGLDAAALLADAVQRRGGTPTVVVLTDGKPNVARDGSGNRARAEQDALAAARRLRGARIASVLVDTAPRPLPFGRELAAAMEGRYVPLPHAEARGLSAAVMGTATAPRTGGAARGGRPA